MTVPVLQAEVMAVKCWVPSNLLLQESSQKLHFFEKLDLILS
jgi:hypothetical protein